MVGNRLSARRRVHCALDLRRQRVWRDVFGGVERPRFRRLRLGLERLARVPRPQSQSAGTLPGRGRLGRCGYDAAARGRRNASDDRRGYRAVYTALTAAELWSERPRTMQSRWPAIAVPVAHGFALMLPILLGNLFHLNAGMYSGSIWVTIFSVELMLYAIGTVFVIFILVSERAVTVHKTAASMDPLTGIFNRRGFEEATARVIEREATAGRPVTVLIFDIDHFKSINDRFGHPAGDEILKLFSTIVIY